ncbi:MAG: hypothetical protein AAGD86_04925 [Pseudomonadota bacterium]
MRLHSEADGERAFSARYELDGLKFPSEAQVFIEAHNANSYMRFAFGTIGAPQEPADTRLHAITRRPLPKFRLKVVDNRTASGLLLGVADQIVPQHGEEVDAGRQALLPVDFCDLGERTWRIDLTDWPVLELNNRIDSIGEAARSSGAFLGLVYPEVLRRVLREIVVAQEITDPEFDEGAWPSLWLRFACALPGVGAPPDGSAGDAAARQSEWIEQAVEAFCQSQQARRKVAAALVREIGG